MAFKKFILLVALSVSSFGLVVAMEHNDQKIADWHCPVHTVGRKALLQHGLMKALSGACMLTLGFRAIALEGQSVASIPNPSGSLVVSRNPADLRDGSVLGGPGILAAEFAVAAVFTLDGAETFIDGVMYRKYADRQHVKHNCLLHCRR